MSSFLRKGILHKGKIYTDDDLTNLMDYWKEESWVKWQEENNHPSEIQQVDKDASKSLELSEKQLDSLKYSKLNDKATSWKSRQRSLRRKGKLDQSQIDKLNRLGMVWNPLEDLWEKNYEYFKYKGMLDPIEHWVNEQRKLFKSDQLPEENLIRLKAANFSFEEKKNEAFKLDNLQITAMQDQLLEGKKVFEDPFKEYFIEGKKKKTSPEEKKFSKTQIKKYDELSQMKFDDFKIQIDELFTRKYIYDKEPYFINSKQGHCWVIYSNSLRFLNGVFETGETFDDKDEFVVFKLKDDVMVYAAEKVLNYLDKFMLGSGEYNDIKNFPSVGKLITYYSKNKMIADLARINLIIQKNPILKAIYDERIRKILVKYNKV